MIAHDAVKVPKRNNKYYIKASILNWFAENNVQFLPEMPKTARQLQLRTIISNKRRWNIKPAYEPVRTNATIFDLSSNGYHRVQISAIPQYDMAWVQRWVYCTWGKERELNWSLTCTSPSRNLINVKLPAGACTVNGVITLMKALRATPIPVIVAPPYRWDKIPPTNEGKNATVYADSAESWKKFSVLISLA